MDYKVTLVGMIAASLVLVSQLPQLYRSLKTKKTHDLSLGMILLLMSGAIMWLLYGIMRQDPVITYSNVIMLAIVGTLLVVKLRYN